MDHIRYSSPKEASQPSQIQILTTRLKSRLFRKVTSPESTTTIRERGESVTAECCPIGVRAPQQNDIEAEINVANTIMSANNIQDGDNEKSVIHDPSGHPVVFKSYPERWWLLTTVVILNLANYSHWVAFPSVAKNAAKYYDQTGEDLDLIPTVSYGLGVPCCLIATYVVENYGLKVGLHIGGSLTGIGGLMCFLSSLPYLSDGLSNDTKFYLALIGQALTGVACPFISCVPTKISQLWFSDDQRTLATALVGMSNPMGIVLGQGLTPLLVNSKDDVPLMNIVWFIPAGLGSILTMWKVKANHPPSAPSLSALKQMQARKHHKYFASLQKLIKNPPFLIMFFFVGGAMGFVSCISTKIEQILCSRGYSDQLSGLSGSLILLCGTLASFPLSIIGAKTGHPIILCKVTGFFVIASMIGLAHFMLIPHQGVAIAVFCALMGIFALGVYPIALELIVECTYPVDQAIGTAFIFLSSALQGVFLMQIENALGYPLTEEEMQQQSCVDPNEVGHLQPMNYTTYLYVINGYMIFFILLFIFGFKTEMKRSNADRVHIRDEATPTTDASKLESLLPEAEMKELEHMNKV